MDLNVLKEIEKELPKGGVRAIYGQCRGKPGDVLSELNKIFTYSDSLLLAFSDGEIIEFHSPRGMSFENNVFKISEADKVLVNSIEALQKKNELSFELSSW